ncbi:EAL domain-containing protein [Caminibacter profundus]
MLGDRLDKVVKKLDFAFQPIVNIKSGEIFAVEALLRKVEDCGFYSIFHLFDEAFRNGVLYQLDLFLRYKVIEKFSKIKIDNLKLFYNLDNRILLMPDYKVGNTEKILEDFSLNKEILVFELSEKDTIKDPSLVTNMVNRYKQSEFKIAIDDFGTGIAGLQLLYYAESDFIKIDRFFIQNITNDSKKKLFCSHIVNMAHIMGMKVIAEGVESKEEFFTCKEIGVDFLQGYFIQKPDIDYKNIKEKYPEIEKLYKSDLRENTFELKNKYVEYVEPIFIEELSYKTVFNYLKKNKNAYFIPVIDKSKDIKGILLESDIRDLIFSPYGMSLAYNDSMKKKLKKKIKESISVEASWDIDKILKIYNINREKINYGIFVTQNNKYKGFLNLNNLLHLSYKKNLQIAEEKNPLTRLPGNKSIDNFMFEVFQNNDNKYYIVYFDFDNFKPFNDIYGFRQGDRAILLFSEILKKYINDASIIGHIGGDDFFVGFKNYEFDEVYKIIKKIQKKFKIEVESLYSKKDREKGYIKAMDRFGIERKFELLSVSAVVIEISKKINRNIFDEEIGNLKKFAKKLKFPLVVGFRS